MKAYEDIMNALIDGMADAIEGVMETRGYLHKNCHCKDCEEHKAYLSLMDKFADIIDTSMYALKNLQKEHEALDKDMEARIDADLVTGGNADLFEDDPYDGGCPADTQNLPNIN
jgi:hypothetical protein